MLCPFRLHAATNRSLREQIQSLQASLIEQECKEVTYHFSRIATFQEIPDHSLFFVGVESDELIVFSEAVFQVGICTADETYQAALENGNAPRTMTLRRLLSGELLHLHCGEWEKIEELESLGLTIPDEQFAEMELELEDGKEIVLPISTFRVFKNKLR